MHICVRVTLLDGARSSMIVVWLLTGSHRKACNAVSGIAHHNSATSHTRLCKWCRLLHRASCAQPDARVLPICNFMRKYDDTHCGCPGMFQRALLNHEMHNICRFRLAEDLISSPPRNRLASDGAISIAARSRSEPALHMNDALS
jgi:hypothetical protein